MPSVSDFRFILGWDNFFSRYNGYSLTVSCPALISRSNIVAHLIHLNDKMPITSTIINTHTKCLFIGEYERACATVILFRVPQALSLTLYMLNFSEGKKHIFTFYVIPPRWHDTGSWNPSLSKTRTCLFYMVNIMAVGDNDCWNFPLTVSMTGKESYERSPDISNHDIDLVKPR